MRRSSRARPNPPPSTAVQHTNSSSSAPPAGRPERNTRSNNKISPSRRGSTQRSQSIDDPADSGFRSEHPHTRHRQRDREEEQHNHPPPIEDEYDEEDEKTRCICGKADYPGLPLPSQSLLGRSGAQKGAVKEEMMQNVSAASDPLADEPGSLFIQCDKCQVWQHGGCVGIMDEASCPDEYFCEECRKDLHKIITHSNGQKCSHYVPVVGPASPSSSGSSSRNNSRSAKDKKAKIDAAAAAAGAKRRSTMNSRDAAYDEEEQLRRALAESKGDNNSVQDDNGSRKGKRTRSDEELGKQATKRQRTGSLSSSSVSKPSNSRPASEDEAKPKTNGNGNSKKTRATATRNQRDRDNHVEKEPEEETAPEPVRRKGRSNQRKGEAESEPPEASPPKPASNPPTATPSAAETPDIAPEPVPPAPKQITRKSGRPARRGRVGRNQYTRDRDVNGNVDSNYTNGNSPRRGQSRDGANADSPTNGIVVNGETGRPSRPRYMNPNRTTLNEMRRRVAGILEFISRMQLDMAASGEQVTPPNGNHGNGDSSSKQSIAVAASLVRSLVGDQAVNGDTPTPNNATQEGATPKGRDFKELSSVEMMDVLTRDLLKWQEEYGRYGDK